MLLPYSKISTVTHGSTAFYDNIPITLPAIARQPSAPARPALSRSSEQELDDGLGALVGSSQFANSKAGV